MGTDNHGGIIWFMSALIILTLSGVFLSMLAEKRYDSSRAGHVQADASAANARVLLELQGELGSKMERRTLLAARAEGTASGMEKEEAVQMEVEAGIASLGLEKYRLQAEIRNLESEFSVYRARYRQAVWAKAAGERMDILFIKSGRQFEKVVINRVTPLGLDISHAHGIAKVDFMELSLDFRDRFQWDEEERARILAEESNARAEPPASQERSEPAASPENAVTPDPQDMEIAPLRAEITLWRNRISRLSVDLSQAQSQSRYGNKRSVPGSLRTWGEQAVLLKQDITRAEVRLALSIEKLRDISPNDPALVAPR